MYVEKSVSVDNINKTFFFLISRFLIDKGKIIYNKHKYFKY